MTRFKVWIFFVGIIVGAFLWIRFADAQDPHSGQPASCHNDMAKGSSSAAAYCDKCKKSCDHDGESTKCLKYCKKDDCACKGGCTS